MPIEVSLPEGVPLLTTCYMYITGGCNLACRHCWITPTFEREGGTGQCLDYELYKIAIEEAIPLGLRNIKFTGGEPLLHPDFVAMVDYATEKGLQTWLETNGTLITDQLAHYLKDNTSLDSISVSLDGATAATHEYMRSVPGSFEMARRGIIYLVEAGYSPQVIMSLYPGNVDEIESLVHWAEEVGCGTVKFNVIQPSGRAIQMAKCQDFLSIEGLVELGRYVEKDLQNRVSVSLIFGWSRAFHGIRRLSDRTGDACKIHNILGILATGQLSMCGIGTEETDLIYGHLGRDRLAEIWTTHPVLVKLRDTIPSRLEGICSQCLLKVACLGGCLAQNYHTYRRLTAPFWFCQLADEAGMFPSSRRRRIDSHSDGASEKFKISEEASK